MANCFIVDRAVGNERDVIDAARTASARGDEVIGWTLDVAALLEEAGIAHTRAVEKLSNDPEMVLYRAAADWTKAFAVKARVGETSLRDALRYRDTTLWFWVELYLHHNTTAVARVRTIEQIAHVVPAQSSGTVSAVGLDAETLSLLASFCRVQSISSNLPSTAALAPAPGSFLRCAADAAKVFATAAKARLAPLSGMTPADLTFISHAAFWKSRAGADGSAQDYEHYLEPVLAETRVRGWAHNILGVGPGEIFRTRSKASQWRERFSRAVDERFLHVNRFVNSRVARASWNAFVAMKELHSRVATDRSIDEAFMHRGVAFGSASRGDLLRALLHQAPWAARCIEEFREAFHVLKPRAICLYAESSGLGRAALVATKSLGIKSLGLQHGILYPNYFSLERSADDLRTGTPIPDMTALYGDAAARLFRNIFRYPADRVVVTGAPQFDALRVLVRNAQQPFKLRERVGAAPGDKIVVLASRYKGIRETHKASGPEFARLLSALFTIPNVRLVVKPHPAEPQGAYDKDLAASSMADRTTVIADRPLSDLLPSTDLLLTVESLSATEALVAGVPVVILRHPSNLRDIVASGAALGVPDREDPAPVIRALLFDSETRTRWSIRCEEFLRDSACSVDGHAAERMAQTLRTVAGSGPIDSR